MKTEKTNRPPAAGGEPVMELTDRVYTITVRRRFLLALLIVLAAVGFGWFIGQLTGKQPQPAPTQTRLKEPAPATQPKPALLKTEAPVPSGPPAISFYHWRTVYQPSQVSLDRLKEVAAERLYVRFFEVAADGDYDGYYGDHATPRATAVFKQKPSLPVVPVVYLDNQVFGSGHQKKLAVDLADKVVKRVLDMGEVNGLTWAGELHLDCDWTPSSKEHFFAFVAAVKEKLPPGWQLAVTLRLDQFRNHRATGVPPADKGVLMAYNMGNLRQPGPGNSILDRKIAGEYLEPGRPYPLPLDVALPLFNWVVAFDALDNFHGLLRTVPPQLRDRQYCREDAPNLFTVIKSFPISEGWPAPEGWRLRLEDSRKSELLAVAGLLAQAAPHSRQLIFYHLDEALMEQWPAEDLRELARHYHSNASSAGSR